MLDISGKKVAAKGRYGIWTGPLRSIASAERLWTRGFGHTLKADYNPSNPPLTESHLTFKGFCQVLPSDSNEDSICNKNDWPSPAADNTKLMIELSPGPKNSLPCAGDSGSPAFAMIDGKTWLIGIVSHHVLR